MGYGDGEDVPRAVEVHRDPTDPGGPFVDGLPLGRRRGSGGPSGKVDGIEIAAVAKEDACTLGVDQALFDRLLGGRRRRWHRSQTGQNGKGADPPSGESGEGRRHGLTVSRKARSFPGARPTRFLTSAERGSFRS